AQTAVWSGAEGDVLVRSSRKIERVGALEFLLVAIGSAEIHHGLLAFTDLLPAQLHVALGAPAHVDHGRAPAEQFFASAGKPVGDICHQPSMLIWVFEERDHA